MTAIEIKILPDARLLPAALSAVRTYAEAFFTVNKDIDRIILATEEAINNVLSFSRSSHLESISITAHAADGEFTVCVLDRGMPGNYEEILSGEDRLGLTLMQNAVDTVSVENLGMEGRCQKLVKYYTAMPDLSADDEPAAPIENSQITVRSPRRDEMLEVTRLIYGEYGFTYGRDIVYYPDRFYAAVEKDELHSTVAVDENGNIAGHHLVFQWETVPGVWESGMAVVSENYRNAGVFGKMMARSEAYARDVRAKIFLGGCVTVHPYTQKLRLKYGNFPCGFSLNILPPDISRGSFMKENEYCSEAYACIVSDLSPAAVYLPEELLPAADLIYGGLNLPRTVCTDHLTPPEGETRSAWFFSRLLRCGSINFTRPGSDFARRLASDSYELKCRGAEIITLYISAGQPGLTAVYEAAKAEGFFFTGLLPAADQGDVLMMQKTLKNVVDYDSLITVGPFTTLLGLIRALDPDQKEKLISNTGKDV